MSEQDERIHTLLHAEREAPGMPDEVAERLARRFNIPIVPTSPPSAPTTTNLAPTSTDFASTTLAIRAALGAAIFAIGTGAGIYIDRTWLIEPAPVQREVSQQPIAPTTLVAESTPTEAPNEVVPSAIEVPAETVTAPVEVTSSSAPTELHDEDRTDTERLWIERAESAFGRGETRAALAAIQAHRRHFPRGRMNEERDALEVRVLFLASNHDEAVTRADHFRATYPRSIFLPQIEAAHRTAQARDDSSTEPPPTPQTPSNPNSPDPRTQ